MERPFPKFAFLSLRSFLGSRTGFKMSSTETPFVPRQISPKTAPIFAEIIGTTSEDVTSYILKNLLPPFPPDSVILDNGCGTGEGKAVFIPLIHKHLTKATLITVTSTILSSHPPPPLTITIHCTDANAYMISSVQESIISRPWPNVKAEVMRAQELSFPDNFFTHSFTNFVVANLDDGPVAAGHLYRTLKSDGIAVVCTWKSIAHGELLIKAHRATRGEGAKLALTWGGEWYLPSRLKEFMVSGGFQEEKIRMEECEIWLFVRDLRRWATIVWSFLGARAGDAAWTKEDEEKWDEVVEMVALDIEASGDCRRVAKGFELRFVANIAVAMK
jgi:ubiquinone/menaquinone biosynthesis C-methylase UbiE